MAQIARYYKFSDVRVLTGPSATSTTVLDEIRSAAWDLPAGSYFLLTFAGLGTQEKNKDAERPPEQNDQTWCLYDRELLDDELRLTCWPLFRPGTRVLVIIDACHSGTSISLKRLLRAKRTTPRQAALRQVGQARELPPLVSLLTGWCNRGLYKTIRQALAATPESPPSRSVLSIAACGDGDTTPDGYPNGMFTGAVAAAWDEERFVGSHEDFFRAASLAAAEYGGIPRLCCRELVDQGFLAAPAFKI